MIIGFSRDRSRFTADVWWYDARCGQCARACTDLDSEMYVQTAPDGSSPVFSVVCKNAMMCKAYRDAHACA